MYTIPLVGPMVIVYKFSRPHFNKFYNDDVDCKCWWWYLLYGLSKNKNCKNIIASVHKGKIIQYKRNERLTQNP